MSIRFTICATALLVSVVAFPMMGRADDPPKKPDLHFTGVTEKWIRRPEGPVAGAEIFIQNRGTAPSGRCKLNVETQVLRDGKLVWVPVFQMILPPIKDNCTCSMMFTVWHPQIEQAPTRYVVDATKDVDESSEDNNTFTVTTAMPPKPRG